MPKAKHYSVDGKVMGDVDLPEEIFGVEPNEHVVWGAVKAYQANQRQGTAATKTRSMVRGGGRKPWRQKGTGRARQGSRRAPNWVGGATVFGPRPRSYSIRIPKKQRRLALVSAMSTRAAEGNVGVVDDFTLEAPKTKRMVEFMKAAGLDGRKVCVITRGADRNVVKSCDNIPEVAVLSHASMNIYDLVHAEVLLFTSGALEGLKEGYGA